MANPTTNFGWQMPTSTDLVTDLPADFEVFGQAVDTALVDLKGGTTDQVLAKNSNTDMDFKWVTSDDANAIQNAIVDAKGDLIAATANDTPARLAVGANGETLVADSSTATGLKWAAASGKVVQAITARTVTSYTNSTTTPSNTLTLAITPSAATSKILFFSTASILTAVSGNSVGASRPFNTTSSAAGDYLQQQHGTTAGNFVFPTTHIWLDSPASTSAQTYTMQIAKGSGSAGDVSTGGNEIVIILVEIGA